MNPSSGGSLLRLATPLFVGRGLSAVITFAIPVVLARLLVPADFGAYKQFFLLATTAALLLQLGLSQSLYYFLPRQARGGAGYLASTLLVLAGFAVVGGLVLGLNGPWLGRRMSPAIGEAAPWLGAYVAFSLVASPLEITLIARKRLRTAALTFLGSDILRTAALVVPVLLTGRLLDLLCGAALHALLRAVAMAVVFIDLVRREPVPERAPDRIAWPARQPLVSGRLVREILAYALPFGGAAVFVVLQQNWHQYAVAMSVPTAAFAVYAVGCFNLPVVDLLYTPISEVMMVRMGELAGRGGPGAEVRRASAHLFREAATRLALVFFPLAAVLIATAPDLIAGLYTATYLAAVPIFVLGTLDLVQASLPADGVLRAHAQTRYLLVANVGRLALTALLVWVGMRRSGQAVLLGAMAGFVAAQAVTKLVLLARCRSVLGVSWSELIPVRTLLQIAAAASLCMTLAVVARAALARLDAPALLRAAAGGTAYALGYALLVGGAIWLRRRAAHAAGLAAAVPAGGPREAGPQATAI